LISLYLIQYCCNVRQFKLFSLKVIDFYACATILIHIKLMSNFYMILYFTHQYLICMLTFVKLYYNVPILIMFHYYFSIKKKYLMKLWHKKLFFCTDFPMRSFLCKNPYIKNNTNHTLLFTRIYYCKNHLYRRKSMK
jgi:hypothetical protein